MRITARSSLLIRAVEHVQLSLFFGLLAFIVYFPRSVYCALRVLNKRRIFDSTANNLPRTSPFTRSKNG